MSSLLSTVPLKKSSELPPTSKPSIKPS
jgi:hypothetical protein